MSVTKTILYALISISTMTERISASTRTGPWDRYTLLGFIRTFIPTRMISDFGCALGFSIFDPGSKLCLYPDRNDWKVHSFPDSESEIYLDGPSVKLGVRWRLDSYCGLQSPPQVYGEHIGRWVLCWLALESGNTFSEVYDNDWDVCQHDSI
ncbi:uncharacterized protein LY89DRAFT_21945 [Mollisia scopiformis]|uniref:Uncharacterized protein n=1 Tax=Mollisia scopiformis TaxID=149040 RepID=A0A194XWJ5_MOLSC|nr:uncharacterized protein LY89DRAFT_21945 [Mollisia scopiformis]KUJ24394.1 hypothetical protein LY89DRAFT_21945 [Mollisia scopiformis]